MNVPTLITYASLILVVLLLSTATAMACSCLVDQPPCESFSKADAVFSGQVISIKLDSADDGYRREHRVVRLLVKESFRGVSAPEIEVFTGLGGGDCGFGFQLGKDYLVYAYERQVDRKLETGICTRTNFLAKAQQDLKFLKGLGGARPGSTLNGEIQRNMPKADGAPELSAMAKVRVVIEGVDQYEAISDEKGKFSLSGIKAGNYKVRLVLPKGLSEGEAGQKVELADKGCASVSFVVVSDGRLAGTVFDVAGQFFEKAEITILEFGKPKYQGFTQTIYSNNEGKYEFTRIPAGQYILQIRFDGLTSQTRPFPEIYHPNTLDHAQASVIEIGEGESIEKVNIYLPAPPYDYRVEGVVVGPDGQFVPAARVEYSSGGIVYGTTVDSRGQFSFKAYEGVTISVRAVLEANGKHVYSDWWKVHAATRLKLVLPDFPK